MLDDLHSKDTVPYRCLDHHSNRRKAGEYWAPTKLQGMVIGCGSCICEPGIQHFGMTVDAGLDLSR